MVQWFGIPLTVTTVEVDEAPLPGEAPAGLAVRLARAKARIGRRTARVEGAPPASGQSLAASRYLLAADTVVDLDGVTLGKPVDAAEAREILAQLRGRSHRVHTAVAIAGVWSATHAGESPAVQCRGDAGRMPAVQGGAEAGESPVVRCVTSDVQMRPYTDAEIEAYIATGDPADKAGAYAIQHPGFHPVAEVHVCYANVVGLPLCAVVRLLRDASERMSVKARERKGEEVRGAEGESGWEIDIDVPALCRKHFGYDCPLKDEGRTEVDDLTQRRKDAEEQYASLHS